MDRHQLLQISHLLVEADEGQACHPLQVPSFLLSEYSEDNPEENNGLSDRYVKFLKKNKITYHDRLCDLDRSQYLSGYGFMQGAYSAGEQLETLKRDGIVRVPFWKLYDMRQYHKSMNGCYMEIKRVA